MARRSSNDQTDSPSDPNQKMAGSSLVGTVLAGRYKIVESAAVDSFKAHDLVLDQTVTVREAFLTSNLILGERKPHNLLWYEIPIF